MDRRKINEIEIFSDSQGGCQPTLQPTDNRRVTLETIVTYLAAPEGVEIQDLGYK